MKNIFKSVILLVALGFGFSVLASESDCPVEPSTKIIAGNQNGVVYATNIRYSHDVLKKHWEYRQCTYTGDKYSQGVGGQPVYIGSYTYTIKVPR